MPLNERFAAGRNVKMKEDDGPQSLCEIVSRIDQILSEAQTVYAHEVDLLIHERCRDPKRIEHLLDGLLDFCSDPEMLGLYKESVSPLFRHKSGGHGRLCEILSRILGQRWEYLQMKGI